MLPTKSYLERYKIRYSSKPVLSFRPALSTCNWREILSYLKSPECSDIKKIICEGCPTVKLWDKNATLFAINKSMSLDQVKKIVAAIKIINSAAVSKK